MKNYVVTFQIVVEAWDEGEALRIAHGSLVIPEVARRSWQAKVEEM